MRRALAITAAALALSACSAEFWDLDPPTHIPLAIGASTLRIDRVEVRSSFYNPPDEFSAAFEPAFREGAACFSGTGRATAVVFIHELTRYSDLLQDDGRLRMGGPVDIKDARGRVIGRYPINVDIPGVPGDLADRRRAAARAFGQALCDAAHGLQAKGPADRSAGPPCFSLSLAAHCLRFNPRRAPGCAGRRASRRRP